MSQPTIPAPAKLVAGVFMKDPSLLPSVARRLARAFGPPDIISPWMNFDFTGYYEDETGAPLFRRMFAFKSLTPRNALAEAKLASNAIEKAYARDKKRRVNIDPGHMTSGRFVLATGKNHAHRIYVGQGIFADLTLLYQKGAFCKLPWTYPDYFQDNMLAFLKKARDKYKKDLAALQEANAGEKQETTLLTAS
jgi:hypothetical protein